MASFIQAHKKVAKSERGYTNNPSDTGNWVDGVLIGTNYGISAPTLKTYLGRSITVQDMVNLTPQMAGDIFKKLFWDKIKGDDIKNQSVAEIIYDMYVNQTGHTKYVMNDVLAISVRIPFSDEVVKAINKSNSKNLFNSIKEERRKRYIDRANNVAGQRQFLNGWLSRLDDIKYQAINVFNPLTIGIGIGALAILGATIYYIRKELK